MKRAWVENNNIYVTIDDSLVLDNYIIIDDKYNCNDLTYDGTQLRLKTEAEKEADRKLQEKQEALRKLQETDAKMARVAEDIIDMLLAKGIISIADVPAVVLDKINERKNLRQKIK